MIMKVAIGLANTQRFGQRMHLMNGEIRSYDTKKSITNYYENENIIM